METIAFHEQEILYSDHQYQLRIASEPSAAALVLLEQTTYGTAGIRYTHTGQRKKLADICPALCFHLYQGTDLVGFFCLDPRTITLGQQSVTGYYGRYFAIAEQQRGHGLGKLLIREVTRCVGERSQAPCLLYVYIEQRNTRSLASFQHSGYRMTTTCATFVFRRVFPKKRLNVVRATDRQIQEFRTALSESYPDSHFVTTRRIGHGGHYYVCFDGDRLIGGLQANPVTWKFSSMPGLSGKLMMTVLPRLPVANRLFRPHYTFLAVDSILLKSTDHKHVPVMLESVLAHTSQYTAILQCDMIYRHLFDGLRTGFLSGLQHGVLTGIYYRAFHVQEESVTALKDCFISSFDFT